jgi:hypothetical protein
MVESLSGTLLISTSAFSAPQFSFTCYCVW